MLSRPSRRDLLRLGALSAAGVTSASLLGAPARAAAASDYRALVCVFLYGGADTLNLLVPLEPEPYADYAAARGDLAVPTSELLPVTPVGGPAGSLGIRAAAPELRDLFDQGRLAFLPNTGCLVRPTTKAEFEAGGAPLPTNLLSHVDQQREWHRAWSGSGVMQGWVGRMLDRLAGVNGDTPLPPGIAVGTTDLLMTGVSTSPYVIGPKGVKALPGLGNPELREVLEALGDGVTHPIGAELSGTQHEAIEIFDLLSAVLPDAPDFGGLFPGTPLGEQLRMVAALVSQAQALGVSRQVFFVSRGGFDTHDLQTETLPTLLAEVSGAVGAFQTALGQLGLGPNVVTAMQTEFGRSLGSNGKGSDHGWGGHPFVVGEPVLGGRLWGALPSLAPDSPDVLDVGHLVPTQSVDQYAATLARWFGLGPEELDAVFPNLANFDRTDLGFLG